MFEPTDEELQKEKEAREERQRTQGQVRLTIEFVPAGNAENFIDRAARKLTLKNISFVPNHLGLDPKPAWELAVADSLQSAKSMVKNALKQGFISDYPHRGTVSFPPE